MMTSVGAPAPPVPRVTTTRAARSRRGALRSIRPEDDRSSIGQCVRTLPDWMLAGSHPPSGRPVYPLARRQIRRHGPATQRISLLEMYVQVTAAGDL
jgi:hypothetical protein